MSIAIPNRIKVNPADRKDSKKKKKKKKKKNGCVNTFVRNNVTLYDFF